MSADADFSLSTNCTFSDSVHIHGVNICNNDNTIEKVVFQIFGKFQVKERRRIGKISDSSWRKKVRLSVKWPRAVFEAFIGR